MCKDETIAMNSNEYQAKSPLAGVGVRSGVDRDISGNRRSMGVDFSGALSPRGRKNTA